MPAVTWEIFPKFRLIRSVNREISVYSEYDEFLKLAHNPEMRFVFSNTTEAGISLSLIHI